MVRFLKKKKFQDNYLQIQQSTRPGQAGQRRSGSIFIIYLKMIDEESFHIKTNNLNDGEDEEEEEDDGGGGTDDEVTKTRYKPEFKSNGSDLLASSKLNMKSSSSVVVVLEEDFSSPSSSSPPSSSSSSSSSSSFTQSQQICSSTSSFACNNGGSGSGVVNNQSCSGAATATTSTNVMANDECSAMKTTAKTDFNTKNYQPTKANENKETTTASATATSTHLLTAPCDFVDCNSFNDDDDDSARLHQQADFNRSTHEPIESSSSSSTSSNQDERRKRIEVEVEVGEDVEILLDSSNKSDSSKNFDKKTNYTIESYEQRFLNTLKQLQTPKWLNNMPTNDPNHQQQTTTINLNTYSWSNVGGGVLVTGVPSSSTKLKYDRIKQRAKQNQFQNNVHPYCQDQLNARSFNAGQAADTSLSARVPPSYFYDNSSNYGCYYGGAPNDENELLNANKMSSKSTQSLVLSSSSSSLLGGVASAANPTNGCQNNTNQQQASSTNRPSRYTNSSHLIKRNGLYYNSYRSASSHTTNSNNMAAPSANGQNGEESEMTNGVDSSNMPSSTMRRSLSNYNYYSSSSTNLKPLSQSSSALNSGSGAWYKPKSLMLPKSAKTSTTSINMETSSASFITETTVDSVKMTTTFQSTLTNNKPVVSEAGK